MASSVGRGWEDRLGPVVSKDKESKGSPMGLAMDLWGFLIVSFQQGKYCEHIYH